MLAQVAAYQVVPSCIVLRTTQGGSCGIVHSALVVPSALAVRFALSLRYRFSTEGIGADQLQNQSDRLFSPSYNSSLNQPRGCCRGNS